MPSRTALISIFLIGCSNETTLRARLDAVVVPVDCDDALVANVPLTFAPRAGCAFSEDGNLEPRNEFIQARTDEARSISLTEAETVCGVTLASDGEAVSFDDHLSILVDDVVVVGGGSGIPLDEHPFVNGLPRFDWEVLRGRPFGPRFGEYECLGDGQCRVPNTEEVGPLDIDIDARVMGAIAEDLDLSAGFDVRILTFGDDDGGDCAHSALGLELEVRYLP